MEAIAVRRGFDVRTRGTALVSGLLLLLAARPACAVELSIAAAADLQGALDELVVEFCANHPRTGVRVSYGSSGTFHAQLLNRAPFDLYFSADMVYPRTLAEAGHALDREVFHYAVGRVVVWVPADSPVDLETLGIRSLLAPSVKAVAMANPRHAPYGAAALAALKSLGVHDQVERRLVLGENVAQTAHFVRSGAADIGLLALALARAPQLRDAGRYWEIPLDAYPRMDQGGMILKWTKAPGAARAFRDWVLGGPGRDALKRHGFLLPGE